MNPAKKSPHAASSAFTLVEVALALAISTFSILSLAGLLAVVQVLNRDTTAETQVSGFARDVASDLLRLDSWTAKSSRYGITPDSSGTASPQTFYLSESGEFLTSSASSRYRVDVTFGAASGQRPPTVRILISWPSAAVDPSSFYEIVTALNPKK